MMKYVNTNLATKSNTIKRLAVDNDLENFRFKDYE